VMPQLNETLREHGALRPELVNPVHVMTYPPLEHCHQGGRWRSHLVALPILPDVNLGQKVLIRIAHCLKRWSIRWSIRSSIRRPAAGVPTAPVVG
jgi:hypothetical protein